MCPSVQHALVSDTYDTPQCLRPYNMCPKTLKMCKVVMINEGVEDIKFNHVIFKF